MNEQARLPDGVPVIQHPDPRITLKDQHGQVYSDVPFYPLAVPTKDQEGLTWTHVVFTEGVARLLRFIDRGHGASVEAESLHDKEE